MRRNRACYRVPVLLLLLRRRRRRVLRLLRRRIHLSINRWVGKVIGKRLVTVFTERFDTTDDFFGNVLCSTFDVLFALQHA